MPGVTDPQSENKPLIDGIDINNPDAAHEKNAEFLRNFPIDRNVFRLYAKSTGLFIPVMGLLGAILDGKSRMIPILDYQLVVLRMTGLVGADYLFGINTPVARQNGMGDERIEALRKGSTSKELIALGIWSERQQAIITLVEESVKTWTNKEETIQWAKSVMTEDEVVEVFIVLGFYSTIARMTKALNTPKDAAIPHLSQAITGTITRNEKDE
jgi:alkylhydroperoxidase family enzyme